MLRRLTTVPLLAFLLAGCAADPPEASPTGVSAGVSADTVAAESTDTEGVAPAACSAPVAEGDSLTVVFFGDSLTAGYGLGDPEDEAYPGLIEDRAQSAGLPVRVVNAGVSGETSAGGRRRIEWLLGSTRPDVFVLALGANDGLRGLDPGAMQDNLAGILDCVKEAVPDARLVLAGMEALPNYGADYTGRFRAVYPALAQRYDATLIPFLLDGVGGVNRLNQPDGIHPTAEGQRVIAETVWGTLGPVLQVSTGA